MTNPESELIVAGVSDGAVRNATGKNWEQWFRIIDGFGGAQKPHKDIARHLSEANGLSGWWSQMVTVGYEQARGMRVLNQKGAYFEISRSRTYPVPIEALYKAWSDGALRQKWLPGFPIHIRKATPETSMRITWSDQVTGLNVYFYRKGLAKSQVTVQHVKLPDADRAEQQKAFWESALARLDEVLLPAGV